MNPAFFTMLEFISLFRMLHAGLLESYKQKLYYKNHPDEVHVGGAEWARLIHAGGYNTLRI